MKVIFIATSIFTRTVNYQFKKLGEEFTKNNIKVVYILDCPKHQLPKNTTNLTFYNWPSKRPTKVKDFIFLYKLIKKYKPYMTMSMFGAGNVMSITSYFSNVKNRIIWIRTTSKQLELDAIKKFKHKLLTIRKKAVYRLNTHIFTNSKGTLIDSINQKYVRNQHTHVFNNLYSSSEIKYNKRVNRDNSIIIAGRIHYSKGHIPLIKQFKDVLLKFPNLKLTIIGCGNLKNRIITYSREINVYENLIFKESLPQRELFKQYSKSLITINASISESFGNTLVESLREGTPIIATKTEGSSEIINNKNGLFYSNKLKYSLLNCVTNIMNDWEQYSKNALISFHDKFKIEHKIGAYADEILENIS